MRRLCLALLCVAVVFPAAGEAARGSVERGIVIRVRPPRLAIRELDGSRLRFGTNGATVITLNGRRVPLARLRRGDVATIDHAGSFVLAVRAVRP
jgi:ribosomal protein L14